MPSYEWKQPQVSLITNILELLRRVLLIPIQSRSTFNNGEMDFLIYQYAKLERLYVRVYCCISLIVTRFALATKCLHLVATKATLIWTPISHNEWVGYWQLYIIQPTAANLQHSAVVATEVYTTQSLHIPTFCSSLAPCLHDFHRDYILSNQCLQLVCLLAIYGDQVGLLANNSDCCWRLGYN